MTLLLDMPRDPLSPVTVDLTNMADDTIHQLKKTPACIEESTLEESESDLSDEGSEPLESPPIRKATVSLISLEPRPRSRANSLASVVPKDDDEDEEEKKEEDLPQESSRRVSFAARQPSRSNSWESSSSPSSEEEEVEDNSSSHLATSGSSSQPRRRSILKTCADEEIVLRTGSKHWKNLPEPDMSKVRANSAAVNRRPTLRRQSSSNVGFSQVQIREYDQTIGDNPSVSYGPPISLDWNYQEMESINLDDYESKRRRRRSLRQMSMNYYTRKNILAWEFGHDEKEIKKATKDADKIKRGRAVTKYFLPYSMVEDAVTSAGRKAKRAVKGGGKKNSAAANV